MADPTGERPLRCANDPYHDDAEPTIWGGRIAWALVYGSCRDARPVVYTRTLSAPRSRPSARLPGVRRRGITDRAVGALELWRGNLAAIVYYPCDSCTGIVTAELRLDDVRRRTATQVAVPAIGLAAQNLAARRSSTFGCAPSPQEPSGPGMPDRSRAPAAIRATRPPLG